MGGKGVGHLIKSSLAEVVKRPVFTTSAALLAEVVKRLVFTTSAASLAEVVKIGRAHV